MRYLSTLAVVAVLGAVALAQQTPAPALDPFLREVRARLQTDGQLQYYYSFIEHQKRTKLDSAGRPTEVKTAVIESRPSVPGEGRWERVIERDGKKVPAEELKRDEEKRLRRLDESRQRAARQTDADRARQEREWAKQRKELADTFDDVFRLYDIRMVGREMVDGHATRVFTLMPKPDVKPISDDGKWFRHFSARAWVSESDHELVRADVVALDDVSVGFGLLARIHEGTKASVERQKLADGGWVPLRTRYMASARVLLLKQVREEFVSDFSDYRRPATAGSGIISP